MTELIVGSRKLSDTQVARARLNLEGSMAFNGSAENEGIINISGHGRIVSDMGDGYIGGAASSSSGTVQPRGRIEIASDAEQHFSASDLTIQFLGLRDTADGETTSRVMDMSSSRLSFDGGAIQLLEDCDEVIFGTDDHGFRAFNVTLTGIYPDGDGSPVPKQITAPQTELESFDRGMIEFRDVVLNADDGMWRAQTLLSGGTVFSNVSGDRMDTDPASSGVFIGATTLPDAAGESIPVRFLKWQKGSYSDPLMSMAPHTGYRQLETLKGGDFSYSGALSWSALNTYTRSKVTGDLKGLTFELYGKDTAGQLKLWVLTEKNGVTVDRTADASELYYIRALTVSGT